MTEHDQTQPDTEKPEEAPVIVDYVELHCHSAFSMLDGASVPEELVQRAQKLGYRALAITDHDELGGAVRFAAECERTKLGGIIGAELTVEVPLDMRQLYDADAPVRRTHLTLLSETREGYHNLSQLITYGRMQRPRGKPAVPLSMLADRARGLTALSGCPRGWIPRLLADGRHDEAWMAAGTLRDMFHGHFAIECWDHRLHEERRLVHKLRPLAARLGVPWVVTNDVHYANAEQRLIHDVLCALRHNLTLDEMGTRLRPNAGWGLKPYKLLQECWQGAEEGLHATIGIAERCTFRHADLEPALPEAYQVPPGQTADECLARIVYEGAHARYGSKFTIDHDRQIRHELDMIRDLKFAGFFLTVLDIVNFARREGILCQGRGSAANSAVCYCLHITAVDPIGMNLLFERFLSGDRREYPDIDIDFAHRERERVLQYVYSKYGREHAAMVCEHITWRGKSAVRDAARVLGFSPEQGDVLSAMSDRFSARMTAESLRVDRDTPLMAEPHETARDAGEREWSRHHIEKMEEKAKTGTKEKLFETPKSTHKSTYAERHNPTRAQRPVTSGRALFEKIGLDPDDHRVRMLADIVRGLNGLPRHRSIHVGGFILTEQPLGEVVPIEPASMADRTVIQWEKDDLDGAKLVKVDLLGLGMLTLLQDCLAYIKQIHGVSIDIGQLDMDDPAVYDTMCAADTIGVFQIESRAQMQTLPRLKPREFYDLVVEVALIRPGPIQGKMVHPYLRRRNGSEKVTYLHSSLEPILKRTLGVPLFQEQGMQVAVAAAGFTKIQADQLRRAMAHKRSHSSMQVIVKQLIKGMEKNNIENSVAEQIYHQINAFADYGFPESHSASFAMLVYASAYLRYYYAPEFTVAILNAQPMGFYSSATLVEDAKRHGVEVRPVDLTKSGWDHSLELPDGRMLMPKDGKLRWDSSWCLHNGEPMLTVHGGASENRNDNISAEQRIAYHKRKDKIVPAVRLGLRLVRGLGANARATLEEALEDGPFTSIEEFVRRVPLDRRALRALCESGAFDVFFPDEPSERRRRVALWALLAASRGALPLAPPTDSPIPHGLAPLKPVELTEVDYRVTGLSLRGHPMQHLRSVLALNDVRTAKELQLHGRNGESIATAGLVICRQRPSTAKGFVFLTLEDETGLTNVVITPQRFEPDARLISTSHLLLIRGVLQVVESVVNVRAHSFRALKAEGGAEHTKGRDFH